MFALFILNSSFPNFDGVICTWRVRDRTTFWQSPTSIIDAPCTKSILKHDATDVLQPWLNLNLNWWRVTCTFTFRNISHRTTATERANEPKRGVARVYLFVGYKMSGSFCPRDYLSWNNFLGYYKTNKEKLIKQRKE